MATMVAAASASHSVLAAAIMIRAIIMSLPITRAAHIIMTIITRRVIDIAQPIIALIIGPITAIAIISDGADMMDGGAGVMNDGTMGGVGNRITRYRTARRVVQPLCRPTVQHP